MKTGVYTYRLSDFQGGYITYTTPAEIIGETTRSYKIRLTGGGAYGATPGRIMCVRKKSVAVDGAPKPAIPEGAGYRFPYKD